MPPTFERTTATLSRAAEYFIDRELASQTGQPRERFWAVVVKELLDNACDACEHKRALEAYSLNGDAPRVHVSWQGAPGADRAILTVADNGCGIPPDTVTSVFNFETRTSDKVIYRSPTRGAQGNALKTILGIPYALGIRDSLILEAQGVRHTVLAAVDPAANVHIQHDTQRIAETPGTRVHVTLPTTKVDLSHWGRAFALFNPHVSVKICPNAHPEMLTVLRGGCRVRGFFPSDDRLSWPLAQILAQRPHVRLVV